MECGHVMVPGKLKKKDCSLTFIVSRRYGNIYKFVTGRND